MSTNTDTIPAEELVDMSDKEIEKAAHERAIETGKDESRVRGGMKAMRTQMQEGTGIGAAVLNHQSGLEAEKNGE